MSSNSLPKLPIDSPPKLPIELVYEITRHLIPPSSHVKHDLKKREWPRIRSLSLSSQAFRRAALDCWFTCLFIREGPDWREVERYIPAGKRHIVSRLHIFPAALDQQAVQHLKKYENLKTLSVNMHVVWQSFPESSHLAKQLVPFIPRSITTLEISCMSVEQFKELVPLLASIADGCRSLRRLGFYSAASDCRECLEETRLPFPIPERSAQQLADDLAQSLSNLNLIQSLSLPIHLSHGDICERHLHMHPPMRVHEQAAESDCTRCVEEFGPNTRNNEQTVAGILAERLESLQNIYFGSWVYGRGRGGVRFVRRAIGSELNYELVPSYIDTQEWDAGRGRH